jgi:hypothetical protein
MSYEEKQSWISAIIAGGVPPFYFTYLLSQMRNVSVAEIAYARPLLMAIGASIALTIVAIIVMAIVSAAAAQVTEGPHAAASIDKTDERDKRINRHGEYFGGIALGVGMVGPFILTMTEVDHFWIANAMYLAFVLAAITSSMVKIVAYRRGL